MSSNVVKETQVNLKQVGVLLLVVIGGFIAFNLATYFVNRYMLDHKIDKLNDRVLVMEQHIIRLNAILSK